MANGAETVAAATRGRRNRTGTRPITSIDAARTASRVVVLRSGWAAVSAIGTTASSVAATKRCQSGQLDPSTAARTSSSPSLASSDGWKLNEPIPIQRVAPFADTPATSTPASSTTLTPYATHPRMPSSRTRTRQKAVRARSPPTAIMPCRTANSAAPVMARFANPSPTSRCAGGGGTAGPVIAISDPLRRSPGRSVGRTRADENRRCGRGGR